MTRNRPENIWRAEDKKGNSWCIRSSNIVWCLITVVNAARMDIWWKLYGLKRPYLGKCVVFDRWPTPVVNVIRLPKQHHPKANAYTIIPVGFNEKWFIAILTTGCKIFFSPFLISLSLFSPFLSVILTDAWTVALWVSW